MDEGRRKIRHHHNHKHEEQTAISTRGKSKEEMSLGTSGGDDRRDTHIGSFSEFQAAICLGLMSTTVTLMVGHLRASTAMMGPPTYPAPKQHT